MMRSQASSAWGGCGVLLMMPGQMRVAQLLHQCLFGGEVIHGVVAQLFELVGEIDSLSRLDDAVMQAIDHRDHLLMLFIDDLVIDDQLIAPLDDGCHGRPLVACFAWDEYGNSLAREASHLITFRGFV